MSGSQERRACGLAGSDSAGAEAAGGAFEADRSSRIEDQDGPFEIAALSFPKRGFTDASGLLIFVRHRIHSGGFQAYALWIDSVWVVQKPESTEVNSVADLNRQPARSGGG